MQTESEHEYRLSPRLGGIQATTQFFGTSLPGEPIKISDKTDKSLTIVGA